MGVLPLIFAYMRTCEILINKTKKPSDLLGFFVALEGLEPSLKVPETCVLPLHHKALFRFDVAKLIHFSAQCKCFSDFFVFKFEVW